MPDPAPRSDMTTSTARQIAAELAAIRRDIARLQRREAQILARADLANPDFARAEPRPGWPMQRLQAMGAMISTSAPARIAV